MVDAEPPAWMQRSSIRSQYDDVGVSANPTHVNVRMVKQPRNMARLPYLSAKLPHKSGASNIREHRPEVTY